MIGGFIIKRLVTAQDKFNKTVASLQKCANLQTNSKLNVLKTAAIRIASYKLLKLAEEENFNAQEAVQGLYNISDYQHAGGDENISLTTDYIYYNQLKQAIPDAFKTAKAYRGLYFNKDRIDVNNIEESIRKLIKTGNLESWSVDKQYVDDKLFNSVSIDRNKGIPVRITAQVTGIYLPTLWEVVKEQIFENDEEDFHNFFGDVDELFNDEDEILAITPDNYVIYNLQEIKNLLNG